MKHILTSITLLFSTLCASSPAHAADPTRHAVIVADRSQPTLAFAAEELSRFLELGTGLAISQQSAADAADAAWVFQLAPDAALPAGDWEVSGSQLKDSRCLVRLAGSDATSTLHAVYTMLEKAGVTFDLTGPIMPERLDLSALSGCSVRVKPGVAKRGIRQHINFPMDISSYPLAEAREYIRNLARLRYNFIVLHSYTGQFFECPELQIQAGGFFYDKRHEFPDEPLFREHIRNQRVFCIPDIEPIFDNKPARSRAAVKWLQGVMAQAKTCGLTIQFSLEAPGKTVEDGLVACRSVLASYPQIDTLEIITPENSGEITSRLSRHLAIALQLKQTLGAQCPPLVLGVYETGPAFKEGLAWLRQNSPPDIGWSFLPAHGARAVVDALKEAQFSASDWRRSTIHSWLEFDGLMFNQQNSVVGTEQLLTLAGAALGTERIPAIAFNHWRTAENRTAITYAARACVQPTLTPAAFYTDYARQLGIGDAVRLATAMKDLDELDHFSRYKLFNIGFCYVDCWTAPKGLTWTRQWNRTDLAEGLRRFEQIKREITTCIPTATTVTGRTYLRFLENRLQCTALHLQAIDQLLMLHAVCDDEHPSALDAAGKAKVEEHCRAALEFSQRYLELHAQAIADRSCEGTLASYQHTIPAFIKHVRDLFTQGTDQTTRPPPATPGEKAAQ